MKTSVRAGIVTVAAAVALGTAGLAVASAASSTDEPVVKREDTAPTKNTANTVNTAPTNNTTPTSADDR
jgi:hypothetical protein